MKKKGFTLVELLVVIAIIALLMGILMPALARVRQIAYRLYCGTNLSGLGKAMLIYCQDYDDEFPRAGLSTGKWTQMIANWSGANAAAAYGAAPGDASIASCFYLLVKYSEVTPKSFICKGDAGVSEFKAVDSAPAGMELVDLWNFGMYGIQHCSYSYHTNFVNAESPPVGYPLSTQSDPGMAVAADPNPWLKSCEALARTVAEWNAFSPTGDRESIKKGNAITHQFDGQNVLFVDGHTSFEKESFCGVDEDNIYTRWSMTSPPEKRKGMSSIIASGLADSSFIPKAKNDSLLLTDNGYAGKTRTCFPANTIVWVDGEMTEISKVVAGATVDKPALTNTITALQKTVCSNEIEELVVHDDSKPYYCYDIVFENGNSLVVADSHYFLLDSGKWVVLQKLEAGSKLQTLEGPVAIKSVKKRAKTSTGKVYNLKIKDSERYLVGKDGVIARDW